MPAKKKKPTHTIRKPEPKPPAAAVASFVEPEAARPPVAARTGSTSVVIMKRSGETKQKMTLWFSTETVRAVKGRAIEERRNESAIVEEALREYFERRKSGVTS